MCIIKVMRDEVMPEFQSLVLCGETDDGRYIFKYGNSVRKVPKDTASMDQFQYTLYRLERLIRYKRERIAMDHIK